MRATPHCSGSGQPDGSGLRCSSSQFRRLSTFSHASCTRDTGLGPIAPTRRLLVGGVSFNVLQNHLSDKPRLHLFAMTSDARGLSGV